MNGSRYDSRAGTRGDGAYYRPRRGGFFQDLGRLARASGALLRDHALLAREEAKEEGRRVAINASMGATALPFALTALIMLSVALAVGLSGWLGVGWAFLVVGLLDLAIAGILAGLAALRLRREPSRALARTKAEMPRRSIPPNTSRPGCKGHAGRRRRQASPATAATTSPRVRSRYVRRGRSEDAGRSPVSGVPQS